MFIEIQNPGRNPLVGTWASLPTVQTGKQVHLIRVCMAPGLPPSRGVSAGPATQAVIHTAILWMCGSRSHFSGEQPFRRKQDVTNLCALLRNLNTVTSFLLSILLVPSEMEELDVVWVLPQHLCEWTG